MPIIDTGERRLHLPERLYHGTIASRVPAIRQDGLRTDMRKESPASLDAVYFATSPGIAVACAKMAAARHGDEPAVISVAARELVADRIAFDWNLPGGGDEWANAILHWDAIPAERVAVEPPSFLAAHANQHIITFTPISGQSVIAFDLRWARAAEFLSEPDLLNDSFSPAP